jgi:MYXO-CTERM domain-containing protein
MRRLALIGAGLATPALAHDGFHFNPHGGEIALVVLAALAGLVAWVRR